LIPSFVWGVVLLPVLGLGLLVMVGAYLTVAKTDYVVTNTTLYHKRGVLSTNIESVGIDRIQNTEFSQSFSGKQLGYGTIEISTAGSSGSDVTFRSIEDPGPVRDLVTELARGAAGPAGRSGSASGGASPTAAAAGDHGDLAGELLSELRAINESMENVERLLRERRVEAGGESGSETPAGDAGSGTAAEFVARSSGRDASESGDDPDDDGPPTTFGGDGEG
jgi:membrane protein YdbS with pleckstrin-like domain